MRDQAKVFFQIEQDEDGYPGVGTESVWALPDQDERLFTLDNIPFFAVDANLGDVVSVDERDGVLWFRQIVRASPRSLMRIVFFDLAQKDRVDRELTHLGCLTEYWEDRKLLAVSVPNSLVGHVERFLDMEAATGCLDYEEPIVRGSGEA
ncbi:hypothetical protein ABIE56_001742 [Luteibacter sp. 621]|uniref:DUF4265 domain-containing protein n=1 Tax=Luteibacter sp. 621 TaxID=3373916 RepID=UPI003D1DF12B